MRKLKTSKLELNKETISNLKKIRGGDDGCTCCTCIRGCSGNESDPCATEKKCDEETKD